MEWVARCQIVLARRPQAQTQVFRAKCKKNDSDMIVKKRNRSPPRARTNASLEAWAAAAKPSVA